MKQGFQATTGKRARYAFITDARMPNPWNRLPTYWDEEVKAVADRMPER
jgi:hypothetical protein